MTTKESPGGKERPPEKPQPCQVNYEVDEEVFQGTSVHFSERGMLVMCQLPAGLYKKIKLVLRFPGVKNPIAVAGEVVWTNIYGPSDSLSPRGMGVKFLGLERDLERLLADLASNYEAHGTAYGCYFT
jgi:Tfp pilus assembly protein PilZ